MLLLYVFGEQAVLSINSVQLFSVSLMPHGKSIILPTKGEHEPFKWQNQCYETYFPI